MNPFCKKLLTISISLVSIAAHACGPQLYTDETRFSLFRPQTIDDPALMPFHYTQGQLHPYGDDGRDNDRIKNNNEWIIFSNNKFPIGDVNTLQYNTSPEEFLSAYNSKNWKGYPENEFIQWITQKKNEEILAYFAFAKQVEAAQDLLQANGADWSTMYDKGKADPLGKLATIALERLKKGRKLPQFLKERYAFQYVKCKYYNYYYSDRKTDAGEAIDVFDRYLAESSSIVAQWALIYYADIQTDDLKRTRYLLKAFDRSDEKKVRAFRLLDTESLNKLEAVDEDPYYQRMIYVVKAMRNSGRGLGQLKDLYKRDPGNRYINLLIAREINKLEDWIWSPEVLKFHSFVYVNEYYNARYNSGSGTQALADTTYGYYAIQNLKKDKEYLKDCIAFIRMVKDNAKDYKQENFLLISLAHLYNVNEQYAEAEQILKTMNPSQTINVTMQYQYDKIITIANIADLNKQRSKDLIAMTLVTLDKSLPKDEYKYYSSWAHYESDNDDTGNTGFKGNFDPQVLTYLGRKYIEKGDMVTGALLLEKSGVRVNEYSYQVGNDSTGYAGLAFLEKYAAPEDIDKVLALKNKKHKNAFEYIIAPNVWTSDNMYKDLKGTLYLRQENYEKAYEVFSELPEDFWEKNYAFKDYLPVVSITDLSTLVPVPSGNGNTYQRHSKKLIVKEIIDLKQKIGEAKSNREKALHSFHLANALFNISYYGSGWMVSAYGNSSREPGNAYYADIDEYNWVYYYLPNTGSNRLDNYYGLKNAISAYEEVLKLEGKNSETAAAAAIMLVRCDLLRQEYMGYRNSGPIRKKAQGQKYASPYLSLLKNNYSKTSVYQLAKTTCPDI